MSDVRQMLLEESRRLEELSEHNQRVFNRMLPAESRALAPLSPRVREATTPASKYRAEGRRGDEDARDFATYAPGPGFSSSARSGGGGGGGAGLADSGHLHVGELAHPPQPAAAPASSSARHAGHFPEDAQLGANAPQLYDAEQPRLQMHAIAERSVPVDVQAEMKVNAFLRSFHPADRLMAGIHLRLLFSYYKSQPGTAGDAMLPDDLVRLCRAAGLMDGPHAFSNPDVISVAVGVVETMRDGEPVHTVAETAMDFGGFCLALGELAAFRFSTAATPEVGHRTLFRRVLAPLAFHVMSSDLVPQVAVNVIHSLQQPRRRHGDEEKDGRSARATRDGVAGLWSDSDDDDGGGGSNDYNGDSINEADVSAVPGVVGGAGGLLDPLIGLEPDPFDGSRQRAEQARAQQRRQQVAESSLLSPRARAPGRGSRQPASVTFSIESLESDPLPPRLDESGSGGSAGTSRAAMPGTEVYTSPTKKAMTARHPAPALVGLLTYSKQYLLDCFDRYAVASRERNPHVCEEDLEGYMNQVHFQTFAMDSGLQQHLSVPDMCRIFVNNCSSKTLTDGNLVDGLSFTQFVSCITEVAESVYVTLHGCDKYDAMLMTFYWLDMHNGLFGGKARLLLSQRFPLHNAAHCFTSLKVWNMFDFYCSFGNRSNHGLHAQLSSVKCLKLMREHGLIGMEGASDESAAAGAGRRRQQHPQPQGAISVTRVDIIFQKVIASEQKRKALEEAEKARSSSKKRSGGDGLVKDYFTGATASRTNQPARVNFSRKLEYRGFCIFLVEVALFLFPHLHPEDAYSHMLDNYFFSTGHGGDNGSSAGGGNEADEPRPHSRRDEGDGAVAHLERQLLQPEHSMNAAAIAALVPGAGGSDGGGGAAGEEQLIGVIDQFQSLQRLTVLKHVLSRCHDNRLRYAFQRLRGAHAQATVDANVNILQDEISALYDKLARSRREVAVWKRKVLLGDGDGE